jgi:hypothetical protein
MYSNFVGTEVRWDGTHCVKGGIVRGVFYKPRNGGGLWDWTLVVQVTNAWGSGAQFQKLGGFDEVCIAQARVP